MFLFIYNNNLFPSVVYRITDRSFLSRESEEEETNQATNQFLGWFIHTGVVRTQHVHRHIVFCREHRSRATHIVDWCVYMCIWRCMYVYVNGQMCVEVDGQDVSVSL